MRARVLLGIAALFPAALNASPATAGTMAVPVCTGDGLVRTINVPTGAPTLPGSDSAGCCAKGCHSGGSRKRTMRQFDPTQ